MNFEFDPEKSKVNQEKHGISLADAQYLWDVPAIELPAKTVDEPRYMIIGKLGEKCYSCIYTLRGDKIRLISARRSRKVEEQLYHDHIQ